jgi:hypothetical protein
MRFEKHNLIKICWATILRHWAFWENDEARDFLEKMSVDHRYISLSLHAFGIARKAGFNPENEKDSFPGCKDSERRASELWVKF